MQGSPTDAKDKPASLFERLGGETKLRAIISELVGRMASDVMIGFFFRRVPLARLTQREYEHAAAFLGAPVAYTGRPIEAAHGRLKIFAGHFERRMTLLAAVLDAHGVSQDVRDPWLTHQRLLRPKIVG